MQKGESLMKEVRHRLLVLVSMAIAMISVAGCGGDDKSNEPPAELEEQLGFSRSGIMELQSRVENRIRDCMKAQGFDYVPVDPFAQQQALTGKARLTEEEFIKEFGYGISTFFGRASEQANPNDRIRRSLSTADRAAYDRALGGDNPTATFAEAVDSGDFSELGGCTKQASEAAFGGTAVLTSLVSKLDELDERIIEDQRMVKAIESWADCMREKGYRYEEPDETDEDILDRFRGIVGVGVRPGATGPPDPGTSYDRTALRDLQREEVRTAAADLDCEKKEITPVEQKVRPQYESAFRKENRRLLARVRPVNAQ
jgi:hypothetical protein